MEPEDELLIAQFSEKYVRSKESQNSILVAKLRAEQEVLQKEQEVLRKEQEVLQKELEQTKNELAKTFELVDSQNTIIRKYRSLLKDALGDVSKEHSPKMIQREMVEHEMEAHEMIGHAMEEHEVKHEMVKPKMEKKVEKGIKCGDLVQNKRIYLPKHGEYTNVHVATTIWNCIVRFFNTSPNANLMTEDMILRECGRLPESQSDFLTREMIHNYFSYEFLTKPNEPFFELRTRMTDGKPVWIVMIPDWLKYQWQMTGAKK